MTLTGASAEHPWIQKLVEVAEMTLHSRKLLRLYKSESEASKLAIMDQGNPGWCWLPYIPRSKQELSALSRDAALDALVGELGDGRRLKAFCTRVQIAAPRGFEYFSGRFQLFLRHWRVLSADGLCWQFKGNGVCL